MLRAFFMPKVTLKEKVIDPVTGDESFKKKVVNISTRDPYNSIEFHKIADALRIKRTDRLNHHISDKVAVVYNYIANLIKSNDVEKIVSAVKTFQKNTGTDNLGGSELVYEMYRKVRLDMDRKGTKEVQKLKEEAQKAFEEQAKSSKSRAEELRKSSEKIEMQKRTEDKAISESTKQLREEHQKAASKLKNPMKAKEVKHETTSEEVSLDA